ncbi:MAG: cell division protein ZapA [Alphaproteobacteria bacterium]|nr:cell division protein ZapA [Alphaproteobacteria bacterium]
MAKASTPSLVEATKVAVTLHGREYLVSCDAGEESRLAEIVKLVDGVMNEVSSKGSNITETRLFMLTCLMMADELIETRRTTARTRRADEDLLVAAVDHLRQRVAALAQQVGHA